MNDYVDSKYFFGIDLNSRKIMCILIDENKVVIDRHYLYAEIYRGADHMINRLNDTITLLMKKHCIAPGSVSGIGIALPSGYINNELVPFHFGYWNGNELRGMLASLTGFKVHLVSYGVAMGLSELSPVKDGKVHSILAIDVFETLISAGLIVNGTILSASGRDCINIGHMIVDPLGYSCKCGKQGCLEVMGTGNAAIRYYEELTGHRIGMGELKRRIQNNEPSAMKATDRCAKYISISVLNSLTLSSPTEIFLGGDFILDCNYIFERCVKYISEFADPLIPVSLPHLKQESEAYGAGVFALKNAHNT